MMATETAAKKSTAKMAKSAVTGELYGGKVSDELVAAMKEAVANGESSVLAECATYRDATGMPVGNMWVPAPVVAPGSPVPGEYKVISLVDVKE